MAKGKFIVFEGMDGTGKSTLIKMTKEWIESEKRYCIATKEPGGCPVGTKLREIILYSTFANNLTDILLFLANRNEHINRTIKPNLEQGNIVLCDRYLYSSLVYQGYMNNNFDQVYDLHKQLGLIFEPDLLLIFKADPDVTIKRLSNGDKFEMHDKSYFEKIQGHYLNDIPKSISKKCRLEIIDANHELDVNFDNVKKVISSILS